MNQADRDRLQQNECLLSRDLVVDEDLLSQLYAAGVFSQSMMEEVEVKRTSAAKARHVLKYLPRGGPQAMATFVEALAKTGQAHLAEALGGSRMRPNGRPPSSSERTVHAPRSGSGSHIDPRSEFRPIHLPDSHLEPPLDNAFYPGSEFIPNHQSHPSYPHTEFYPEPFSPPHAHPSTAPHTEYSPARMAGLRPSPPPVLPLSPPAAPAEPNNAEQLPEMLNIDVKNSEPEFILRKLAESGVGGKGKTYSVRHRCRGRAVILSSEAIVFGSEASVDALNLEFLLQQLGFTVLEWSNLTAAEIRARLDTERRHPDHAAADAFIFAVLSQGDDTQICGSDGGVILLKDLFDAFDGASCPGLQDKPKVFLVQAGTRSRGRVVSDVEEVSERDLPQTIAQSSGEALSDVVGRIRKVNLTAALHEKTDIFFAFSTATGSTSASFIQEFIHTMMDRCHFEHLVEILQIVAGRLRGRGKTCDVHSTSDKHLYFLPGYAPA